MKKTTKYIAIGMLYFLLSVLNGFSQKAIDHFTIATLKDSLKDYSGAVQEYDLAIQLNPAFAQAWYLRGKAKFCLHDYKGAVKDEAKAAQLGLQNENVFLVSAYAKVAMKEYKAAIIYFDKAIKFNAENGASYYDRGLAKSRLKDKGARADFSKAIELGNAASRDLETESWPK